MQPSNAITPEVYSKCDLAIASLQSMHTLKFFYRIKEHFRFKKSKANPQNDE